MVYATFIAASYTYIRPDAGGLMVRACLTFACMLSTAAAFGYISSIYSLLCICCIFSRNVIILYACSVGGFVRRAGRVLASRRHPQRLLLRRDRARLGAHGALSREGDGTCARLYFRGCVLLLLSLHISNDMKSA